MKRRGTTEQKPVGDTQSRSSRYTTEETLINSLCQDIDRYSTVTTLRQTRLNHTSHMTFISRIRSTTSFKHIYFTHHITFILKSKIVPTQSSIKYYKARRPDIHPSGRHRQSNILQVLLILLQRLSDEMETRCQFPLPNSIPQLLHPLQFFLVVCVCCFSWVFLFYDLSCS